MKNPPPSHCVVFCNFGDNFWVEKNIENLSSFDVFNHYTVIDSNLLPKSQALGLKPLKKQWKPPVRVIPNKNTNFLHASFEHAEALNRVLRKLDCTCDFVWIFDTDLFISKLASDYLVDQTELYDAIFMQDPQQTLFSHPCLSIIRRSLIEKINFLPSEIDLLTKSQAKRKLIDTGRTMAANLAQSGAKVAILRRNAGAKFRTRNPFPTHFPDFYLDGEIVHFKSMSFVAREDAKGRFELSDYVRYQFPRNFVVKISESHSKTIFRNFQNYEIRKCLFYLKVFIIKRNLKE